MNIINDIISWGITGILGFIISTIYFNRNFIYLYCQSIIRWNKEIRVSYAYLFRIKYEGKYLLIKGNRINQFQPIGGVYKYYDSFADKKRELEIRDEDSNNFYESRDLRQIIKGKYFIKYLRWFLSENSLTLEGSAGLLKVQWGEYRIGNLFEKIKTNNLKMKIGDLSPIKTDEFPLPVLTAGVENQGLNNYSPKDNETVLKNVITISANVANTSATFYQNKEFTVLQDAYEYLLTENMNLMTMNTYF